MITAIPKRLLRSASIVAMMATGMIATPACAQATADKADAQTDIIVTASKRPERQLDVPSAITAFRGEDLLAQGNTSMKDYLTLTPGVQFAQGPGGSGGGGGSPVIRGLNTGQDYGQLVGIVVDGAPLGAASTFAYGSGDTLDLDPIDLERVEVLKGPQGTLYGANTLGGLVSYTLASPDLNEVRAIGRAELSDTRGGGMSYSLRGAASAPIAVGTAALRLSAYQSRPGGFIDNDVLNARNINRKNDWGLSGTLLIQPDPRLKIKLSGFYQRVERATFDRAIYGVDRRPVNGLHYDAYIEPSYTKRSKVLIGSIDYDLDFATLTSVTSYQKIRSSGMINATNSAFGGLVALLEGFGGPAPTSPLILGASGGQDTRRFAQELRLTSTGDGPLQYVAGAYYSDEKTDGPAPLSGFNPDLTPVPSLTPYSLFRSIDNYKEIAGFANLTWKVSDAFDITGGLRIGEIRQGYRQLAGGTGFDAINAFFIAIGGSATPADAGLARDKQTVKTWLATARYHFSQEGMVYARFATGFRPGGPNIRITGLPQTYDADTTQNYEAGVKTKFLNGLGTIDINAYYMRWKDILIQVSAAGTIANGLANGGTARVYGAEGALSLNPARGLTIGATLAYSRSRITDLAPLAAGSAGVGDRLPNNPTLSGSLAVNYRHPLSEDMTLIAGTTGRFVGKRHASLASNMLVPDYVMPGYTLIDAQVGIELSHVDISLFVRNLTDKRAQLGAVTRYGLNEVAVQRPRTIGLSALFRY